MRRSVNIHVLAPVSGRYPKEEGRLLTCYSPVRHSSTQQKLSFSVRLACVKHAASVRPEPGSNSPNKNKNVKDPEKPTRKPGQQSQPKHSKTKNRHKKQTNTLSSSQNNTHTIKRTRISRVFSKGVPRHVSATRASRFVHCRSAQQGKQYALLQTSQIKQARVMSRDFSA